MDDTSLKEYDTRCCGKEIFNISPRVTLAALFSLMILIVSSICIFTDVSREIFIATFSGIVGIWVPSPTQTLTPRNDVVEKKFMLRKFGIQEV